MRKAGYGGNATVITWKVKEMHRCISSFPSTTEMVGGMQVLAKNRQYVPVSSAHMFCHFCYLSYVKHNISFG